MTLAVQFCIYIVRHGETEWNAMRRQQGHLDFPLNEAGIRQAQLVAEALRNVPFARAFSSDLQRASKTAEYILQYHPNVTLEKDELMRQRYMGELQGEIIDPSNKPAPSVEKMPEFMGRCYTWFTRTIANHMISNLRYGLLEEPQNLLVVSHGAWISAFLGMLHAKERMIYHPGVEVGHLCLNTGVSIVEYAVVPGGFLSGTLVQYSSVEHLLRQDLDTLKEDADELVDRERKPD